MTEIEKQTKTNLNLAQRVAYGVGDFGINVFWNTTNLFILFFYTEMVGIPSYLAGLIIFGAMAWDAITDPVVSLLAERTNSRFGRFRPYLLFGTIPLAISFVLLFHAPSGSVSAMAIYAFATQLLFRTFYTIVGVPYSSLSVTLTQNPDERGSLAVYRMLFATLAGVLVAALTKSGAGYLGDGDEKVGFLKIAIVFASLAMAAIFFCAFTLKETKFMQNSEGTLKFSDSFRALKHNTAFWLVFSVVIVGSTTTTISGKSLLYYLKYNLQAEGLISLTLLAYTLIVMLFVPIWGRVSRSIGKPQTWRIGLVIGGLSSLSLFLNPQETYPVFLSLFLISGIGTSASYVSVWSTLPDTVEFGELKSGVRAESIVFGAVSFAQKFALGLGTLAVGFLLDATGYIANEPQSETALLGIKTMMSLIPASLTIVSFLILINYKLDQKAHAKIMTSLSERGKDA